MAKGKNILTGKREKFCHEYLVDFNGTQAAIRAGYSARTAGSQGQRLLKNVDIQNKIESLKQEITEPVKREIVKREITKMKYVNFLDDVVNSKITDFVEIKKVSDIEEIVLLKSISAMPDDLQRLISSIKSTKYGLEVKFWDKLKAIDIIARLMDYNAAQVVQHEHELSFVNGISEGAKIRALEVLQSGEADILRSASGGT